MGVAFLAKVESGTDGLGLVLGLGAPSPRGAANRCGDDIARSARNRRSPADRAASLGAQRRSGWQAALALDHARREVSAKAPC
ncbi:MAG: hypothetical protein AB1938_04840 [Myxococcota bacterium]